MGGRPECLLTLKEALEFVGTKLEVKYAPYNNEHNPDKLLKNITKRWMEHIPFTTLKQLTLPSPRTCPSHREALDDVMSGVGGLCATHAFAMWQVLTALGFECDVVLARFGSEADHVCVLVKNVEKNGNLHIVDVGSGYPAFEPIKIKDGICEEY